jgi:putative membrane protein
VPLDLLGAASVLVGQATPDDQMTGYGWVMMIIFATLFAALLVTAIWALASYVRRTPADRERGSPEELLAERYARGDITTEEYQERLDTLRQ